MTNFNKLTDIALAWNTGEVTTEQARAAVAKLNLPVKHGAWPEEIWWEGDTDNDPNAVLWLADKGMTPEQGYDFLEKVGDALPLPEKD